MYKEAIKRKLRFPTTKGPLSVEQVMDLSQADLATSIKAVKKLLKKSDDEDLTFLDDAKTVDVENQLRFDILKDIYTTNKKAADDLRNAAAIKQNNQKIIELIARKEDKALEEMSVEDLKKLLVTEN